MTEPTKSPTVKRLAVDAEILRLLVSTQHEAHASRLDALEKALNTVDALREEIEVLRKELAARPAPTAKAIPPADQRKWRTEAENHAWLVQAFNNLELCRQKFTNAQGHCMLKLILPGTSKLSTHRVIRVGGLLVPWKQGLVADAPRQQAPAAPAAEDLGSDFEANDYFGDDLI